MKGNWTSTVSLTTGTIGRNPIKPVYVKDAPSDVRISQKVATMEPTTRTHGEVGYRARPPPGASANPLASWR